MSVNKSKPLIFGLYISIFCILSFTNCTHAQFFKKDKKDVVISDSTKIIPSDTLNLVNGLDSLLDSVAVKKIFTRKGEVIYDQSNQVDSLIKINKEINLQKCPDLIRGYRVQIFSCSGNDCFDKTNNYYNQFLIAFPNIKAYKIWDPPSHKIRVGDCRNNFEAEQIKAQIQGVFPGVFIVPDFIQTEYFENCEILEEAKN